MDSNILLSWITEGGKSCTLKLSWNTWYIVSVYSLTHNIRVLHGWIKNNFSIFQIVAKSSKRFFSRQSEKQFEASPRKKLYLVVRTLKVLLSPIKLPGETELSSTERALASSVWMTNSPVFGGWRGLTVNRCPSRHPTIALTTRPHCHPNQHGFLFRKVYTKTSDIP